MEAPSGVLIVVKQLFGTSVLALTVLSGTAHADSIGWQQPQPYFTYSTGALAFEHLSWSPLDFAAFAAYGGYFANVRRPEFETAPPVFQPLATYGIDDEFSLLMDIQFTPTVTFMPSEGAFQSLEFDDPADSPQSAAIPEPGTLALVGLGLLGLSRQLRRRRQA